MSTTSSPSELPRRSSREDRLDRLFRRLPLDIAVASGAFEIMKDSIAAVSADRRSLTETTPLTMAASCSCTETSTSKCSSIPTGRHRVYLTDAVRTELPASSRLRGDRHPLRPGDAPEEALVLEIDGFGESWARVAPVRQGERHEIELPFLPAPPDPAAPDPHRL